MTLTSAEEVTPPAEEAPRRETPPGPPPSRRVSPLAFLLPAVATAVALCLRNRYLFSQRIYEDGDAAANSILVQQATRFRLLVGNYSREGFHHPGPAFLYVMAAGQTLFYRLLGVAASPYGGQLLAVFALNATLVGLVVFIFYRRSGSVAASAVAFGALALFAGYHETLDSAWFPHLYFMPFLLLMVAGASVASSDLADLPIFVLAGCLLVHGHVSFIEFVGASTVAVAAIWARRHRGEIGPQLAQQATRLKVSAGLIVLFLIPMVLNVVLHFPGDWGKYVGYVRNNSANTHPLGPSLRYLLSFWAHRRRSGLALALVGVLGAALTALQRDRAQRRFFGCLLGAVAFMSVLFLAYVVRGVDDLSQGYIGIFYLSVPLLVLILGAVTVTTAVEGLAGRPHGAVGQPVDRPTPPKRGAVLVGAAFLVVAAVMVGAGAVAPQLTNPYRGNADLAAAVAAVASAPARAGRLVAVDFPHPMWPEAMGFLVAASRVGLHSCIADPSWTYMVTSEHVCPSAALRADWRIGIDAPGSAQPAPPPIWSDPQAVIVAEP